MNYRYGAQGQWLGNEGEHTYEDLRLVNAYSLTLKTETFGIIGNPHMYNSTKYEELPIPLNPLR